MNIGAVIYSQSPRNSSPTAFGAVAENIERLASLSSCLNPMLCRLPSSKISPRLEHRVINVKRSQSLTLITDYQCYLWAAIDINSVVLGSLKAATNPGGRFAKHSGVYTVITN